MAGLLDQLSGMLTPENVNAIASATGIDANQIQQGLNVAAPLLQGGLANNATSGAGLDSLTSLLGSVGGGGADDPLSGIMGMLSGGGSGSGGATDIVGALGPMLGGLAGGGSNGGIGGMLTGLLGGGASSAAAANDPISGFVNMALGDGNSAIAKFIDGKLGFKITPYLAMAAPFLLGLLKKDQGDRSLDGAGIADLLKSGNDEFIARGGPTAELLKAAKDVGAQAAALKSRFTADQWERVGLAPIAAAAAVIYASPSGSGASKEIAAALAAIGDGADSASPTSLLTSVFSSLNSDSIARYGPGSSRAELMAVVKTAAAAVDANDPGESSQYKALILDAAQKTAEASKEGGFLGFGGKKISDAEADVLAELHSVLSA